MASLLNNASLLLNPAGSIIAYEEDKIFSVLPSNGTGDFTFSGGDGGTRVNQQGYIEITPFNWFNYSNALNTSPWSMNVTGGQTGKDGVANAWLLTKASPTTSDYYTVKPNDGVQTVSFYVKKESNKGIKPYAIGSVTLEATINIETGAVISKSSGVDVVVETYNSSWWRIHVTANVINSFWYWYVTDAAGTQIASTVTLQDMQLVYGAFIKPYQPTTDRLNYPRITYQNGRGALLQEPQRTNNATYSEDLTNGVWALSSVSITSNDTISPDGTQNADRVNRTGTTSTFFYNTNTQNTSNRANSMFFKKGTIDQVTLLGSSYSSGTYATFNLSNGTILGSAGCTPFVEQYKDGWYRCGFVQTNGVNYFLLVTLNGYTNETVTSGEYLYAWGGQSELGGFPTSYIPTTSATVTRAITDVVFNSPGPTKAFPTKDGAILYDFDFYNFSDLGNNATFLYSAGASGGDYFYLANLGTSGQIYWDGNNSGGYFYGGSFVPKQGKNRSAWYFTNSNSYWYVNGTLIYTGTYFDATYFPYMQTYEVDGSNFAINTFASIPSTSSISQAQVQAWTNFNSGSGGNISYYGPYTIHTFTGSATFTPSFTGPVEVLVVAGGGGAGGGGGGGGAGGLLYVSSVGVSQGTGYTITVGAGGVGYNSNTAGTNGSNSSAFGLNAIGGAGGSGMVNAQASLIGGSGGGGTINTTAGSGILGQGNNGGAGGQHSTQVWSVGGGGGGAGAVGQNFNGRGTDLPGNGGIGLPYSISGFSTYYAGGGGGGTQAGSQNGGTGGLGGGGNGGQGDPGSLVGFGQNGVSGLGGGGGASNEGGGVFGKAGNGGNGIVIVRYLT